MSEIEKNNNNCFFCGEKSGPRLIFQNKDVEIFIHLPKNKEAHAECYIVECVKISLEKIKREENGK